MSGSTDTNTEATFAYEWRISAHDPETMRTLQVLGAGIGSYADVGGNEAQARRSWPKALLVIARRRVNLAQTNEVGSWEIVRTAVPDA